MPVARQPVPTPTVHAPPRSWPEPRLSEPRAQISVWFVVSDQVPADEQLIAVGGLPPPQYAVFVPRPEFTSLASVPVAQLCAPSEAW